MRDAWRPCRPHAMPAMTTSAGSTYRRWTRSSCGRRRGHEVAGLLDGPYANFFRDPSVRPFLEHFPERRETLPAVTLDQCSPCSGAYGALAVVCSTFCAAPVGRVGPRADTYMVRGRGAAYPPSYDCARRSESRKDNFRLSTTFDRDGGFPIVTTGATPWPSADTD